MSLSCDCLGIFEEFTAVLLFFKQLIQALGPLTGKDGPIQFFQINTIPSMILMFFCNIDIDIDTVIVVLKASIHFANVWILCK